MIISEKPDKIRSPMDVVRILNAILAAEHETDRDREHVWAIGLNNAHKIKYIELVALGGLDRTCTTPRETFRLAIMRACKTIIVCHNHPSGNTMPSEEDKIYTKQLRAAGHILGISVLDHIIIAGEFNYYSYADYDAFEDDPVNLSKQISEYLTTTKKRKKPKEIDISIQKKVICDEISKGIKATEARLDKIVTSQKNMNMNKEMEKFGEEIKAVRAIIDDVKERRKNIERGIGSI